MGEKEEKKPEYRFYRCTGKPPAPTKEGVKHYFHPDSFMGYMCPTCGASIEVVYSSVQPALMKRIAHEKCNECPQSIHKGLGAASCVGNTHNNSGCVVCLCKECCGMMRRLAAKIESGEKTFSELIIERVAENKLNPGPMASTITRAAQAVEQTYEDEIPF